MTQSTLRICLQSLLPLMALSCGARPASDAAPPSAPTLVELSYDENGPVLAGPGIEVGQLYAVLGERHSGLVQVTSREPADCDHCLRPRLSADILVAPGEGAITAYGPVTGELIYAQASERTFHPGADWSVSRSADLDGDGTVDVEGVSRCGHLIRSGCDETVCDQYCHATRSTASTEVRGEYCQSFIPDTEDCEPSDADF